MALNEMMAITMMVAALTVIMTKWMISALLWHFCSDSDVVEKKDDNYIDDDDDDEDNDDDADDVDAYSGTSSGFGLLKSLSSIGSCLASTL